MRNLSFTEIISLLLALFSVGSIFYDIHYVKKNNKNPNNEKIKLSKIDLFISILLAVVAICFVFVFSPVHVSGESMAPTYNDNDWLFQNKLTREYEKGDVIVFYSPEKNKKLIKRIIGTGGDTIEVKNLTLYVNGEIYTENYDTIDFNDDFPAITVPKGEYFVLGDNRPISLDSRYDVIGTISKEYIEGKIIN